MRWVYSLILMGMIGILAGCSSARTYSDQVSGVNYNTFKTYAWLASRPGDTTGSDVVNNDITYHNLRAAADKEMAARGFVLDSDNPDLLLRLRTDFDKKVDMVRSPLYSSYNNYWYPGSPGALWPYYTYNGYYNPPYVSTYDIRDIEFTEGTVTVDVIDRKQRKVIWRGSSNEEISNQRDVKRMYKDVGRIFDRFPIAEMKK